MALCGGGLWGPVRRGYSVQVCACRETENAIYVHTTLLGPDSGDARGGGDTYPCIVLKMEARDKNVVFQ